MTKYDQGLRLRVLPELGKLKLSEITQADLQDLVDGLLALELSASTIDTTLLPVRVIYRRAVKRPETGIVINPTRGLEMPAVRGGRERIASPEECTRLLAALPQADRALWATAMYAGLRRGELMALRLEDIRLGAGVIHVHRGWDPVEGEISTKSGKARKVPVAGVLRDHLDDHIVNLPWRTGLVFGATAVSPFRGTSTITDARRAWGWRHVRNPEAVGPKKIWTKAHENALEPIRLHECRHTFA